MGEEIKDKEFERIIKEVTDNLNRKLENKLFMFKEKDNKEEPFISTRLIGDSKYYIEIHSPYKNDDFYIREMRPLLEYAKKRGYPTNLD